MSGPVPAGVQARASRSGGTSGGPIYDMVAEALSSRDIRGGVLLDLGAGTGGLRAAVGERFASYWAVDAVAYPGLAADRFVAADLDRPVPLPDGCAQVVAAVEVIEHLENPRAFMRELARLAAPGGWVAVTTPNQGSWLDLLSLAVRGRHVAFQDVNYPAHLTALLPVDLLRIASECGLDDAALAWSGSGRVPLTARHWPRALARLSPRRFSDNVLLIARKPGR